MILYNKDLPNVFKRVGKIFWQANFVTFQMRGAGGGVLQRWKQRLGEGSDWVSRSIWDPGYWQSLIIDWLIDYVYLPMFLFFALLDLSPALPYSAREKRRGTQVDWQSGQHGRATPPPMTSPGGKEEVEPQYISNTHTHTQTKQSYNNSRCPGHFQNKSTHQFSNLPFREEENTYI